VYQRWPFALIRLRIIEPGTPLPVDGKHTDAKKHTWQALLPDAVHETEPEKAEAKTHAAEAAILNRLGDTWPSPGFAEE